MKIEMNMTERDKKLLIFLAIFVIVVCFGYWGIRPNIINIIDRQNEIEIQQEQRNLDDIKIAQLDGLEMENSELENDIVEARSHFYPIMDSSAIDKLMTGTVLGYNLYAYDLNIMISDKEATTEAYKYSEKFEQDQYEEMLREEEANVVETSASESKSSIYDEVDAYIYGGEMDFSEEVATGIYAAHVRMRLGGEPEDMQRLINDLSKPDKAMQLVSYQWFEAKSLNYDEVMDDYSVESTITINIELDIYMCEE